MKKIAIIVALEREYEMVGAAIKDKPGISLSMCGIGKVNAAIGATAIIERERPDAIISTGVAGAIDPSLKPMDVIVARQVAYHDVWCGAPYAIGEVQGYPRFFDADKAMYDKAMNLRLEGLTIRGGLQISGDRFIVADDIPSLRALYPDALSVDMESGALSQTCHRYGIPFISFRIISDSVDEGSYADFWTKAPENSFRVLQSYLELLHED
ncbi:MAG: 5'-methylthioadenosine/S-adenosylhomocysteine nucleosidase [Bacteroidales bacterium]|nr:5'-methylthioadenosine/S-adenosylhomocysteine nucleosidase [Bacteroidales bacterium]